MSTIQNSLMSRRNKKLHGLTDTIKSLSILNRQVKPSQTCHYLSKHPKSMSSIEGENLGNFVTFLDTFPMMEQSDASQNSCSFEGLQTLKTFDQVFQTGEILGEGAHGVVKKCVHKVTQGQFAVKILKMQDQHFHFLKTNFINIKQLKHDSVIKYKALYLNPKQRKCHLVMEYLPFSHLKLGVPEEDLKYLFYKLLDCLEYLHKNHICHRDIKPENIIYDKQRQIFKIIDFGVSKNLKLRGRYEEMLTKTGTLHYKAPEMFDGAGYTQKVDSWAVGITLYEMIVGVTPFASEYLGQTIDNILHKDPDFSRQQFNHYDSILKSLIKRLLNRNPKDRLSCEQAKKHLWFNANLQEISILKSANFHFQTAKKSEEKQRKFLLSVFRKGSLTDQPKDVQANPITKVDKKVMKKWFQMINDAPITVDQQVSIDFVQSEDQEQTQPSQVSPPSKITFNLFDNNIRKRDWNSSKQLQKTQFIVPQSNIEI